MRRRQHRAGSRGGPGHLALAPSLWAPSRARTAGWRMFTGREAEQGQEAAAYKANSWVLG